jgi:hypothetical protein
VVNDEIRVMASLLVLDFFPLRVEEAELDLEYMDRQQAALERMLLDDSLSVRVAAVRRLPALLAAHWDLFPKAYIKRVLHKVTFLVEFLRKNILNIFKKAKKHILKFIY